MKSLPIAQSLRSVGRFREALENLPPSDVQKESTAARLLRAELLAEVGEAAGAASIVELLEKSRGLTEIDRSQALSRRLLKFSGGSVDILRDVRGRHREAELLIARTKSGDQLRHVLVTF